MNRLVLLFLAAVSLVFHTNAMSASNEKNESMPDKVKVALLSRTLNNHTYHDPTHNIETDYVSGLAEKLGIETEFLVYPNVDAVHKALKSHEVDIAVGLSDLGSSDYIFSTPLYKSSIAIWYRNKNLVHMSPDSMKWACVKGSLYCQKLYERGLPNIIEAANFSDAIQHVNDGKADTVLDSYVSLLAYVNSGQRTIGRLEIPDWFGAEDIRIGATADSRLLIHNINLALDEFKLTQSLTSHHAYHKIDRSSITFRNTGSKTVRYTVWEDSYPLFYRDTTGELVGYIPDILKLVESRTSVHFDYVAIPDGYTPLEMLENGSIDFLPSIKLDAHELGWTEVSKPIVSNKYFSVRYKNQISSKNATEGVLFSEKPAYQSVKNKIFGNKVITYTNVKALIHDLKMGELSRAYVREDILNYLITNDDDSRLIVNRSRYKKIDVSLTVRKGDKELSDLIYGVATTINDSELRRIQSDYSPFNVVYGYDKSMVIIGLSILAGIIVLLIFIGALSYKNVKLKASITKKSAQQTQDDLKLLQSIINGLPNQIFIHDVNHKLLLSNCTGVASGRCKHCNLVQSGVDKIKVVENSEELSRVIDSGETIKREVKVETCSAGLETVEYYRTKIQGPTGLKEFVLTVVNDISEQKEQELALRAANDTAQQAVQSRERFLASMSHELRTPIAGMAGLLEMLKIRTDDEDTLMMIDNIITSTRHLHLLVNDILDFSKLEAQQLDLDLRECHLLREAGELLRVHCASAQKKDLDFEVNWTPTEVKVVRIDPLRFSQIINNLLSNAIKFTDEGKIIVDVKVDEQQIHVAVTDTGEGMSQEVIKTVFNPFFQADSTIARRYGGTGLGLSIVHNLIQVMGGSIHIDSEVGEGSTISFSIPYELVRTYNESQKIVYAKYHGADPVIAQWIEKWTSNNCGAYPVDKQIDVFDEEQFDQSLCGKNCIVIRKKLDSFRNSKGRCVDINSTPLFADLLFDAVVGSEKNSVTDEEEVLVPLNGKVLVAEDNPINQLVFKQQLNELGVDVDIVDNGLVALELLQANTTNYDLLITDCHMPVMDGYELVNRIRQLPELSHLTLIGCTAEDSRVANEKAQNSGFDAVLYKPYGIKNLYKLLVQFLVSAESTNAFWLENYDHSDATILSHVYVDTMQSDLTLLKQAKEDKKQLRDVVHRIKGGAGTIGETNIHKRALELEQCMQNREGNLAELFDVLVVDITASIEQTKAWINEQQA